MTMWTQSWRVLFFFFFFKCFFLSQREVLVHFVTSQRAHFPKHFYFYQTLVSGAKKESKGCCCVPLLGLTETTSLYERVFCTLWDLLKWTVSQFILVKKKSFCMPQMKLCDGWRVKAFPSASNPRFPSDQAHPSANFLASFQMNK